MVVGAVLWVACGESKKSSDDPVTTGNAGVDRIVRAYCGTVRSCCATAGFSTGVLGDCEAVFSRIGEFEHVLAGTAVFREPELSQCVALLESLASTCVLPEETPCQRIFEGTVAEGGTCEDSVECRAGVNGVACLHPYTDEVVGPGTCRALGIGQLGSPCFDTIEGDRQSIGYTTEEPNPVLTVCDRRRGLSCNYDTYTCQPVPTAAEPCDGFEGCVDGFYCDGTCLPQLAAGSPCEFYDQCQGDLGCGNGVCAVEKVTDGDLCQGDYE
jgi:hypothetical protein